MLNSLYLLVSIVGLWAGSVYVPTSVREIALREGRTRCRARRGSRRTARWCCRPARFSAASCCRRWPSRSGRRLTLGALLRRDVLLDRGRVRLHLLPAATRWRRSSRCCSSSASAARTSRCTRSGCRSSTPTDCRASAFAFATSVGRFAGAGITFLVGAGVAHFHTIGTPVALTSIAFLIGLLLLPFGEETRGQALPS